MLSTKGGKAVCSKCKYQEGATQISVKETMAERPKLGKGALDKQHDPLPIMEVDCKKCDNNKCYFWALQTRAGDEGETSFFKCVKCGYTWRDYR